MNRYSRLPAILVLVFFGLLTTVSLVVWGDVKRFLNQQPSGGSIESLEQKIGEFTKKNQQAPAAMWHEYADALYEARKYDRAADAYHQVLTAQPSNREVKFEYGLALALSNRPELLAFLKDLSVNEAPLAERLFDRPELQKYLQDDRFVVVAREAKNNAVD